MNVRSKIGFHAAVTGNRDGIGDWMQQLNAAGIAIGMKVSDDYGVVQEVIDSGLLHGVTNWPIYRRVLSKPDDVPNYYIHPHESARNYWQLMINYDGWPPELDRENAWIDVVNEIRGKPDPDRPMFNDMHPVDWVGEFGCEIGRIALRDNWKVCLPSFTGGEPEPEAWDQPGMVKFLTMCGEHPKQIALSVHEYVWDLWKIDPNPDNWYPHLWGRFENAIAACDRAGISRDITIFITEGAFGHDGHTVPALVEGMAYLEWYNEMVARFPQVKFLAFWALDGGWGDIANQVQPYIKPLTDRALAVEFDMGEQPAMTYQETLPSNESPEKQIFILSQSWAFPINEDAALQKAALADGYTPNGEEQWHIVNGVKYAIQPFYKIGDTNVRRAYYAVVGEWNNILWTDGSIVEDVFEFTHWPTPHLYVNQEFGVNPEYYSQFGLPGHEGTDIRAYHGDDVYSVADGSVSQIHPGESGSNYGKYIRILHKDDYETTYAHLDFIVPFSVGDPVVGGQVVGRADSTGNSTGSHLHLTLKRRGHTYVDGNGVIWPYDIHNSDTYLHKFADVVWPSNPPYEPPSGEAIDISKYFEPPEGVEYGEQVVFHFDQGNTQPQQLQRQGDGSCVLWKGEGQWFDGIKYVDYEHWHVRDGQIQKYIDTSDAGNGGRDAYNLHWVQWLPSIVHVGETYISEPIVTRFDRTNCNIIGETQAKDYLTVVEIIPLWTSPKNPGIVFENVLVIEWRTHPGGTVHEMYKFAPYIGYVEWNGAAVGEIPQGRQPLCGHLSECI